MSKNTPRTYFLDRLRVVLTALVIFHHCAITYGGSGGWFYREFPENPNVSSSITLTMLCSINQAFFMGMFFLIAGYFTPAGFERKGAKRYLSERFIRLGLPLLVFGLLLGPMTDAMADISKGHDFWSGWLWRLERFTFVAGPLWFAWALLLFALAYAAWRALGGKHANAVQPVPGHAHWLAAALLVGAGAMLIRQWVPTGRNVWALQLGYFSSYIMLFALGCAAARHRWLERIERQHALPWFFITLLAIPALPLVAALFGAFEGKSVNFNGGWSWPAAAYAFWEPLVAWGIIALLLWQFRLRFNRPSPSWQRWSEAAYAAFILHAPVLVAVSLALRSWQAAPGLKFLVVGCLAVAASFWLGRQLRALPGMTRVL
ncbi:acyltransferase family protein [Paucibacter sp. TC2R-5]|uniref:acyltransferase family protein n=1 Tax=Paucibacter sp. TC2R-5 TaxID=2893555 RepID=UPI0021E4006C|nr:acyltransferase family protein [Paucibacter sp. TC2R-5]MCV2359935.1 acyltransferase family protein [Paucibacter sp. TC2R-5]